MMSKSILSLGLLSISIIALMLTGCSPAAVEPVYTASWRCYQRHRPRWLFYE